MIGLENIPKTGGILICGNHFSNLDPILVTVSIERPLRFMAKKELFKNKLFGNLITKLGAFPIDRVKNSVSAIKNTISLLKNQEAVLLFPQGTRQSNFEVPSVKSGVGLLAVKSGAQIVPFYISGKYGFFKKITLSFGKSMKFESDDKTKEYIEEVTQKIAESILYLNKNI